MSRRDPLVRLLAAFVGVVAIASAAATISSTVETGSPDGDAIGPGEDFTYTPPPVDRSAGSEGIPPFLEHLFIVLVILLAVALAWYLIAHRRDFVKTLAVSLVAVTIVLVVGWLLVQFVSNGAMNATASETLEGGELPGGGAGEGETGTVPFGTVFFLPLVVGLIFAGAYVLSRGRERPNPVVDLESDRETETAGEITTTAGRAADRIANSEDVDNEVYRAWRELTRHLEIDRPESSTPGEFADAAVETGMEREHVFELTQLFEDVRYGHRETTAELEERAVSILRRIQAAHADETLDEGANVDETLDEGANVDEALDEGAYADEALDEGTDADESRDGTRKSWGDRP